MASPAATNLALTGIAMSLGLCILCVNRGNRSQEEKTVWESQRWCGRKGMIFSRNRLIEVVTCIPSARRVEMKLWIEGIRSDKRWALSTSQKTKPAGYFSCPYPARNIWNSLPWQMVIFWVGVLFQVQKTLLTNEPTLASTCLQIGLVPSPFPP